LDLYAAKYKFCVLQIIRCLYVLHISLFVLASPIRLLFLLISGKEFPAQLLDCWYRCNYC